MSLHTAAERMAEKIGEDIWILQLQLADLRIDYFSSSTTSYSYLNSCFHSHSPVSFITFTLKFFSFSFSLLLPGAKTIVIDDDLTTRQQR